MVRVFLLAGTYVEIPNRSLEQFSEALRAARRGDADLRAEGKLGEKILIRTDAITHAVEYRED